MLRERAFALADGNEADALAGKLAMGGLLAAARGRSGDRDNGVVSKPAYILSLHSWTFGLLHHLFLAVALLDCLLLPVLLAGARIAGQVELFLPLSITTDCFLLLRVCGMFWVSFVNDKSVEVFEPAECRRAYLGGECLPDVITSIPINLFFIAAGAGSPQQLFALRTPRLLNARYLYRVYRDWMTHMADDDVLGGMLSTFGLFLIVIHCITCVMDAIGYDDFFVHFTGGTTWGKHYELLRENAGYVQPQSVSPLEELASHCTRTHHLTRARALATSQLLIIFAVLYCSQQPNMHFSACTLYCVSRLLGLLLHSADGDDDRWARPRQYCRDWRLPTHYVRHDNGKPSSTAPATASSLAPETRNQHC
jgi:hypothetical protein